MVRAVVVGIKTSTHKDSDPARRGRRVRAPTLTVPQTAIQLHPEAHAHDPVSQRVEAHHARHNRRPQVFQHNVIGVLIPRHHLTER